MRLEVFCEDRLGLTRELLFVALIYAVLRLTPSGEFTLILLNWSSPTSAA